MNTYHKIQTVFKRDRENNPKVLLEGQYAKPEFEYLAENDWVFTEKVDGTNIRVKLQDHNLTFGGKTDNSHISANLVEALYALFDADKLVEQFPDTHDDDGCLVLGDACLYGEGYGPKIQKGAGLYRDTPGFVLFDVRVGRWWLERSSVADIAEFLNIDIVPIVAIGPLSQMITMCKEGFNSIWGEFPAEGLIGKPSIELTNRAGHRVITKLKSRDFQ